MGDIFRAAALRKLRDPQQLDSAVRLTSPAGWIALAACGLIVAAALAWGFLGTLPYRAEGLGVILRGDSAIFELDAPVAGRVAEVKVRIGERVTRGQVLAVFDLPDLAAERRGARRSLADLERELERRSDEVGSDVEERARNTNAQIDAKQAKLADLSQRIAYLERRLGEERQELALGYITRQQLENTRDSLYQAQQERRDTENEIAQLRVGQTEYASQRRQELSELRNQVADARSRVVELDARSESETDVVSPVDGIVAAVAARDGERLEAGMQVATVEAAGEGLTLYAYLPIAKGKQVEPGMPVEVSPSSIERDIYGSIVGRVESVSTLPVDRADLAARLGESDLVEEMLEGGAPVEVTVRLLEDPKTVSGLAWSSSVGPPVPVTPGTTASASVTVRETRPVDLIVPLYETWLGGRR